MKMIIFALLALAVLVLLLLRKYTRLEFVVMPGCCLKHGLSAAAGALVGVWAQSFPDAALHAWAMLPPDIKGILPPNIVAMISPALVVLAILSQYVRQPKLKEKADEQQEVQ
jgi:hypothetical protein